MLQWVESAVIEALVLGSPELVLLQKKELVLLVAISSHRNYEHNWRFSLHNILWNYDMQQVAAARRGRNKTFF